MKAFWISVVLGVCGGLLAGECEASQEEKQLQEFIDEHVAKVKPLWKEASQAYWEAANSGKAEDYQRYSELEYEIRQIYSDANEFAFLKRLKESGKVKKQELKRQLEGLYYGYLENQIDTDLMKRIVDLGAKIEKDFSTFRGVVDGNKVSTNDIREMLKTERDNKKRKEAWLASKQVGDVVAEDLIRLVKLRNKAARNVGFENYHTLSLTTSEQSVEELDEIFQRLYELTNWPFAKEKYDLDKKLAAMYGVKADELKPWHYHDPFFQETPLVYEVDLDGYYEGRDVKDLAMKFYAGIGLPVESIIVNSDLYEREGKNPHAFCTDIDREGDVRILCNLKNDERWMETMLHELGHAVYDKYHDREVPFLLRSPAHIFTTEAIAMLFGRLSRNAAWMDDMMDLSDAERAKTKNVTEKYARLKQLIFVRWATVMYEFEKELYGNPQQDLNSLWWRLKEKYQFVERPAGRDKADWAAKIHFAIAPCYYHNYVLGELLASQLHYEIVDEVLQAGSAENVSYAGQKAIGDYLREKVFEPGAVYRWDEMIRRATGEELTPKYFVQQFVN